MCIIFDLDQTLIDSSIAEALRTQRNWSAVKKLIPEFTIYDGIRDVLQFIEDNNIRMCIVTSSISNYCNSVLSHWGINSEFQVCYHDTNSRKPDPEPILTAIQRFGCENTQILSVGDRNIDIIASNSANVSSVACLWGSQNDEALLAANPTYTAETPDELIEIIRVFYRIED